MCNQINFSALLAVKVMRDGDGDGKCQEEDGKWVPCPPGVSDGSVINRAGRAIGKIPLGETIGPKPTKPSTQQRADIPSVRQPKIEKPKKTRAERRIEKSKPSSKPKRLDPNRQRPNLPYLMSEQPLYRREDPLSKEELIALVKDHSGNGMQRVEKYDFFGPYGPEVSENDFFQMPYRQKIDEYIEPYVESIYQSYVDEFNARKEADDWAAIGDVPHPIPTLSDLRSELFGRPKWEEPDHLLRPPISEEDWIRDVRPDMYRIVDDNGYINSRLAQNPRGEKTRLSTQFAVAAYKEYLDGFKRDREALFNRDTPLTKDEWYDIVENRHTRLPTPDIHNSEYQNYLNAFDSETKYQIMLDENGNVKPEYIEEYIAARREKAAEKAEKLQDQARNNITPEQTRAARRINLDDYYDATYENEAERWEENNPEPEREEYDNEDDYQKDLDDWNDRRYREPQKAVRLLQQDLTSEWETAAKTMFTHTFTGLDGKQYSTEIYSASYGPYSRELAFRGDIYDENGNKIGFFQRAIRLQGGYDTYVEHEHLKVHKDHRNAGIASIVNALNEQMYRALGIDHIEVTGSSSGDYKGATHWPKNGFTWASQEQKEEFLALIQAAIDNNKIAAAEAAILKALMKQARQEDIWNEEIHPADLLQWSGAEEWFKQQNASIIYRRQIEY